MKFDDEVGLTLFMANHYDWDFQLEIKLEGYPSTSLSIIQRENCLRDVSCHSYIRRIKTVGIIPCKLNTLLKLEIN
jgi:hypothetical protein